MTEPENPLLASMKRQSMVDMIVIATVVVIVIGLVAGVALHLTSPFALAIPDASPGASASAPAATATVAPADPTATPAASGPSRTNPVIVPRTPAPTKPPTCSSNLLRRLGGKMTYTDGQGAAGYVFVVQASNGQPAGSFKTGTSGFWSVAVGPGNYKIQFAPESGKNEWYNNKPSQGTADGIPVCLSDVNNINATVGR